MSTPNLIYSLPNELLVAIASAGQEDRVADLTSPHSGWSTQPTAFCPEWTLSHLSHRFRDVIAGASELWTLTEANFAAEGSVEILKLYLERSRACKISVTLREFPGSNIIEPGLPMWIGQIVVAHLDRIWSLRILVRTWPGGADMLGLFRDAAAPQLQQLEVIHISDDDQFPNPYGAVGFFSSGAPRLSSLKTDGFTLQAAAQWRATLTHLDMRRAEYTLSAINQYLSLAHLRLDMAYVAMGTTPLRLPTLKSLDLWIPEDGEDYLAWILEHFDLPTLTELTVEGSHGDQIALLFSRTSSNFPALASVSFVFRDSCPCETDPDFTPKHTISSPPAVFPALSHLTLINQCFTHTLIQDILGPASHLWPLLRGVTLCPRKDSLANVCSTLEDAVKGKRQRGHPLPKIRLFRPPVSFENWKDISSMDVEMVW